MIKIITDTSSLLTKEEAKAIDVFVHPLMVTIKDQTYRDYFEISPEDFSGIIKEGNLPKSSQPPIGEVVESYEQHKADEVLNITIADGLSGAYNTAVDAKEMVENNEKIHVFNSRTICGPQRYLVQLAVSMAKANESIEAIKNMMEEKLKECQSFLLPVDFDYLKRGGRLTPIAATIGGFLKICPVMIQSKDGKRLDKFAISRTMNDAFNSVIKEFLNAGVCDKHMIYIAHDRCLEKAKTVVAKLMEKIPNANIELLDLSPAFITQGGPGCIAIQYIKK